MSLQQDELDRLTRKLNELKDQLRSTGPGFYAVQTIKDKIKHVCGPYTNIRFERKAQFTNNWGVWGKNIDGQDCYILQFPATNWSIGQFPERPPVS